MLHKAISGELIEYAKWCELCRNALMAEALACCDCMIPARDRGVRRLVLETDSQMLVGLWRIDQAVIRDFTYPFEDMSRSFEELHLRFWRIDQAVNCNKLAHACARLVSRDIEVEEWLNVYD